MGVFWSKNGHVFFFVRPLPENHAVPTALVNPVTATYKSNLSPSETDKKTCLIICSCETFIERNFTRIEEISNKVERIVYNLDCVLITFAC